MIKYLLVLSLLFTPLFGSSPTVKILLTKLSNDALVEVRGRYFLYNPKTDAPIAMGSKKKRAHITSGDTGLTWGEALPGIFEIRIVPADPQSSILVNGIQYKGSVEVYSIGGTINVINEIDAEDYIKAILPPKIHEKYTNETLDAIAIIERTHLYHTIQKDNYASWQFEAEKVGYLGNSASQNASAIQAIDRTRDLILSYRKKPFAAAWSPNNAGHSVSYLSVFRKNSDTPRGVNDLPSIHQREKSEWKATVPLQTLATIAGFPRLTKIDFFRAEKTNKIYAVRFTEQSESKDLDFFALQRALGENVLQSNDFTIAIKGKKAYFTGYGKGSGVGLCALSADILARRNNCVENILKLHFPESQLLNIRQESGK
ncbi:MAG: Amidase enhancer [Chlamydiae bacterium]|nr:Amidase enhancer [Chlamydiota bacterium]